MRLTILGLTILACVFAAAAAFAEITPIAVSNRSLGGADLNQYTLGVVSGIGPNNIGLLVKTWGKVTYVNAAKEYFYIDDGANLWDGSYREDNGQQTVGVRVSYDHLATGAPAVTPPSVNDMAVVTGISSTLMVTSQIRPNLRVSKGSDLSIVH